MAAKRAVGTRRHRRAYAQAGGVSNIHDRRGKKTVRNQSFSKLLRRSALSVALGLCFAPGVQAQSNATGSIFGQAEQGSSILVTNPATGYSRTIPVDGQGRFRAAALPPGTYNVQLVRDGQTLATREGVAVTIAGGSQVDFAGAGPSSEGAVDLAAIVVTATAVPSIDVSTTDTRTVFTAEQLEKLPLARDVTAVALLAPSVISSTNYSNASTGGQVTSFGGSAASENAYYINGYPVTNPLTNIGFTQLPYDAMSQTQILTGGYGAEFGRSTGGVINIITKRGTNEWQAGGIVTWEPEWGRGEYRDIDYPDTGHFPATDGTLYQRRRDNELWRYTYGAYVGGPIIEDKLFFYATGEVQKRSGTDISNPITAPENAYRNYKGKLQRWMGKIDWNITDDHTLELTGVGDTSEFTQRLANYSYADARATSAIRGGLDREDEATLFIGKYTGYLTDNLTLTALYGEQKIDHRNIPFNYNPDCPRILGISDPLNQMPGINYVVPCSSPASVLLPGANDKTRGGRLDIEYRLGDHDLRVGIDDQVAKSLTGSTIGGGFSWAYNRIDNRNAPIDASNGVGSSASGGGSGLGVSGSETGYYVTRGIFTPNADVEVRQRAYYIEDRWHLNDNMLLSLGLRNENFENYNGDGDIYIEQKDQWAPRLGFSWDVLGDSSLKVFANAGRYHLAVPNNVAVRGASGSINGVEYYTYTGVNPDGSPSGLNPIPVDPAAGRLCPDGRLVSANLECGQAPDPNTVAAKGIKPHFQDEFALGMEHQLNESFSWGVKGTYRTLRSAIDDTCSQVLEGHCFLFNPGESNTFLVANDEGGYDELTFTSEELGYPKLKRDYWAIDLYAEHPFSNNWYGKIEYTWSKNYGNTEGQLNSETDTGNGGQADVSVTQDWDLPQLMVGANGLLPNHREHQIKAFGYYQPTPEWTFGVTAILQSGRPISCTSFYPTPDAGLYNSASYRYCGLPGTGTDPDEDPNYVPPSDDFEFSPRGSKGTTPWMYQVNLSVAYRPTWAGEHLTFGVDVLNVFDRQTPEFIYQRSATNRVTRNPRFGQELYYTDPRAVRFSVRYDF